ncbi:MAG: hypothetical protein J7L91_03075 [Candidatus Korarchaeota archaeon]|nr:hypothetical protein [Candidatus Korarchaeota archaeon]
MRYPENPLPPCFAKQHGLEYRYHEKYDYGYTEAALTKFYRGHRYDLSRLEPHMEEYKTYPGGGRTR